MRYSIITPTILRESLLRACHSVDVQTCQDWEHIIMVDSGHNDTLLEKIKHSQRHIFFCDMPHRNWGNTCRFNAYEKTQGDYLYSLDDDNYLADEKVLEDLKAVTKPWAIFPILDCKPVRGEPRRNTLFYNPPRRGQSDGGSILVRREIGRWPNALVGELTYDLDGQHIERLSVTYPYDVVNRVLMVYGEPF